MGASTFTTLPHHVLPSSLLGGAKGFLFAYTIQGKKEKSVVTLDFQFCSLLVWPMTGSEFGVGL